MTSAEREGQKRGDVREECACANDWQEEESFRPLCSLKRVQSMHARSGCGCGKTGGQRAIGRAGGRVRENAGVHPRDQIVMAEHEGGDVGQSVGKRREGLSEKKLHVWVIGCRKKVCLPWAL
jgi:hypothetical protein